jgi:VWFA-related protein
LALSALVPAQVTEHASRVSVDQLEGILAKAQGVSDTELASQLTSLQLTERLTSTHVAHWSAGLPGARSQRALLGLADRSAFLPLPASDMPSTPAPDFTEQRRIMGLAADYVSKAIPQLPHFVASRTITHFEDLPGTVHENSLDESDSLHAVRVSHEIIQYREGEEMRVAGLTKVRKNEPADQGLRAWGSFGPILGLVLLDAAQNKLAWAHWEQGANGPLAVFQYSVPKERSHYEVRYCCVAESYGLSSHLFSEMSAYHGEISVDPASGVIARLSLQAELGPDDPISRAGMVVEYGQIVLGGNTYNCPVRSISISVAKTLRNIQDPSGHSWIAMGPPQMLLNHADFDQYHLFSTQTRILTGEEERAAGVAPDATLPHADATDLPGPDEELADAPAPEPMRTSASAQAPPAAEAAADTPEINTAVATGLSETPANTVDNSEPTPSSYSLRISTRLVDVNVVAVDKKGHPIPNLKESDFEVYDNGVKQDVRSFMQTEADADASAPAAATVSEAPHGEPEFSNRSVSSGSSRSETNSIVLLIDGSNLDYNDFVDARQQMVHFLRTLHPGERVALYAMKYHGFQVLHEATTDHEALATQLAKWAPTAHDMSNAQDEERRNRQQIETVLNPEDMLNVNGSFTLDSETQAEGLDPKLRELGSRPVPNALDILVAVAHHLRAMPGHKNLIWVTSDNALADWNKLSINIDKGARYIEPITLRTQEAMNRAHVSVYPLDASKLEANVITADTGHRNVELSPTYERPADLENRMEGPESKAGLDMNYLGQGRNISNPGRLTAQLEQDSHSIQGVFREVADATGGRIFRRSSDIVGELNNVVADGHATYLLGFSPHEQADGKYHLLTVKLNGHKDAVLRFRSGYQYDREPTTLKERFAQAIWDPVDASDIAVSTKVVTDASGSALRVTVAGSDLSLTQQNAIWAGKLNIFFVRRDQEALRAKVTGLTVGLRLKQPTYQRAIKEGLTFDERLDQKLDAGSLRVVVIDVNTGHMGSVTVPAGAVVAQR